MNDDFNATGTPRPAGVPWEREAIEKLLFAQLNEQRAARRWKLFFRLMWLLVIVAIVWLAVKAEGMASSQVSTPHTAVIAVEGTIASGAEASAENVLPALKQAFEDEGAQAIVLLINSPGGSPVQAGEGAGVLPLAIGALLERNCGCHYVDPRQLSPEVPAYFGAMPMATWPDFHTPFMGTLTYLRVQQRAVVELGMPPPYFCDSLDVGSLSAEDHALLQAWLEAGAPDAAAWGRAGGSAGPGVHPR